jgi:hypothetical protein
MIFTAVFWITVLLWLIFCRICYLHFYRMRKSYLVSNIISPFANFDKMKVHNKVAFILSMIHALTSLGISLYLLANYHKHEIYDSILYHIAVAVSLSHYITDMLVVGYYEVQYLYIVHHTVSIIMITIFYINSHISPQTYPFSMVFMEITNPFQIIFSYLINTKQTKQKRFFVVSTIFTFMFTFVRTLVIPFIYLDLFNSIYNEVKITGFQAIICEICGVTGVLGGLLWNYGLLKGYYNKVYLPIMTSLTSPYEEIEKKYD